MFALNLVTRAQDSTGTTDTLKQYVADLQKNPGDDALREKIIKLALTLNPKPALPDEAITHEGAAEYAFKNYANPPYFYGGFLTWKISFQQDCRRREGLQTSDGTGNHR